MNFRGRTVATIIEFPNNKILLVKRATAPFIGYWALVGGRVEIGETIEQAVIREVKEETGLVVEMIGKVGEYHEKGVKDGIKYDYYPACFLAKPIKGKIKRQKSEIEHIKLFSLRELPKRLAFEHLLMIQDYIFMYRKRK